MFVILGHPRSGTHLLAHLLNSHPDLKCYDELFLSTKAQGSSWENKYFLEKKPFEELGENEGCIVMYSQFYKLQPNNLKKVRDSKVIHLVRNDIGKHLNSLLRVRNAKPTIQNFQRGREAIANYRAKALSYKLRHMYTITYEQICGDKEITEYEDPKLLEFLGVRPYKLTTNLPKQSLKYEQGNNLLHR